MPTDPLFELVSELANVDDFVEEEVFTEVSDDGEIYTTYRIVRITDLISNHPERWTHRANVVRIDAPIIGVCLLRIEERIVMDAQVVFTRPAT